MTTDRDSNDSGIDSAADRQATNIDDLHDLDQAVVAPTLELLDRAAGDLRVRPLDHAVDQLRRQLRHHELSPGQLQRQAELLEEVTHPNIAATEEEDQARTHEDPAQTRTIDDRGVDLVSRRHPFGHHVQRL